MQRRPLGTTGLMVSELGLGTVELGLEYGISTTGERLKPDECRAARVLNEALELGINLLDTARVYGDAEEIIGRVLKGRRDEFFLLSKVAAGGNTRQAVEQSPTALQTSHVDVMMIHCAADALPDEATAAELANLRGAGKIRYPGASVYGEEAALPAMNAPSCDCIEIAYSILDLARSVLLKVALTSRLLSLPGAFAPLHRAIGQLLQVTRTMIENLPELAYRYVLMHQPPHSALVGSARIDELRACVAYSRQRPLPDETVTAIRALPISEIQWLNPSLWPPYELP